MLKMRICVYKKKHGTHSRDAFFPEFNSTLTVIVHSGTVRPQRTSPPFSVLLPQPRLGYREHRGVPKWHVSFSIKKWYVVLFAT